MHAPGVSLLHAMRIKDIRPYDQLELQVHLTNWQNDMPITYVQTREMKPVTHSVPGEAWLKVIERVIMTNSSNVAQQFGILNTRTIPPPLHM